MAIPKKGTKRPAAASVGARKRAKTATTGAACKRVSTALVANPMLAKVVNKTLGVYADERHEFQNNFVQMIGEALGSLKVSLEQTVATAQAKVDGAEAEKGKREQAMAAAEEDVKSKQEALAAAETTLASSTETADASATALKDAEQAKKRVEAELADATKGKEEVEATQAKFVLMKDAPGAPADVKAVKKAMDHLDFGHSQALDYIPDALKKEPALRSQFDSIIMKSIDDKLSEKLTEFTQSVATATTDTTAQTTALEAAKAANTSAIEKKSTDKSAKDEAAVALKASKNALKQAKAAIASYESDMKSATKALSSAQSKLIGYSTGALAAFEDLKDKVTPPPEPPKGTATLDEERQPTESDLVAQSQDTENA